MAKIRALALLLCLVGLAVAGAGGTRADGFRFRGWRLGSPLFGVPHFGEPNFAGPRYDGALPYDVETLPPPPHDERGRPPPGPPPGPRKCYSPAETRERVASKKLREPFEMMRKASAMTRAEALAGKLCRWNDEDIYVISLLRHDGALIRVFMNAVTGQVVGARKPH
ncbi:hypothetical protein K9U39_04025 [Rhodoblastus acidophilus]|uniref:PepSY domain-containing protein n=1 Tax=Candidatus Rhodoblastus alkanivorans TaxID=2954117 RepID=A0ABS9Z560_9HYPH|nr:hypothetical protein [Candidatus Rhodoblastus alkanivorans]MCI4680536.1 hypothetical protein [Candidatus Rhodoblastus alkanivorans]MCI4682813.1 hypothetical protein [Candidatus Rhodoblastus alkanivorans]MDI4640122.1 hypothetical protein [Rhodoblastus acidophilus]